MTEASSLVSEVSPVDELSLGGLSGVRQRLAVPDPRRWSLDTADLVHVSGRRP